eukprot:gene4566-14745_t
MVSEEELVGSSLPDYLAWFRRGSWWGVLSLTTFNGFEGGAADPPVALVTGSNRGIGKAIAQELSKQGAKVCINYIDLPGFKEAAQETASEAIEAGAADAMIVSADVSKKEEIEAMVKAAIEKFGSLDIMVNNAVWISWTTTPVGVGSEKL